MMKRSLFRAPSVTWALRLPLCWALTFALFAGVQVLTDAGFVARSAQAQEQPKEQAQPQDQAQSQASEQDTDAQNAGPAPLMVDGHESEEIWINTSQGRLRFTAEIADDPAEQSTGLMFREKMPPDHGMLFDFGEVRMVYMWMRNTPLPLDMVFLSPDGTVTRIAERTTPFSEAIISSGEEVSHVLELNGGVSRLIGLKPGDRIEHPSFRG